MRDAQLALLYWSARAGDRVHLGGDVAGWCRGFSDEHGAVARHPWRCWRLSASARKSSACGRGPRFRAAYAAGLGRAKCARDARSTSAASQRVRRFGGRTRPRPAGELGGTAAPDEYLDPRLVFVVAAAEAVVDAQDRLEDR